MLLAVCLISVCAQVIYREILKPVTEDMDQKTWDACVNFK
jgi:hypothetical protein